MIDVDPHINQTFYTRIAPTPSGFLHLGNLFSFVLTWLWARLNNGKLLLRIDDIDFERCRDEYLHDIFDTLQFFGINYDEGPRNIDDFKQNFSQANRLERYAVAIEKLKSSGCLYACICSRKDMHVNQNPVDPLNCKQQKLPLDTKNAALRINIENNSTVSFQDCLKGWVNINLSFAMPDFIVRQKNGLPSYQICSLVDDVQFGITYIVRGDDLLPSTAAQLYLAKLLDEENCIYPSKKSKDLDEINLQGTSGFQQTKFLHHSLLKTKDGNKLSKSAGDTSIQFMRNKGLSAKQILHQITKMMGIKNCEAETLQELLQFINANDGKEIGIFAALKG